MKSLGVIHVQEAGTGEWEEPHWTMLGAVGKDCRVGLLLPTLGVPAVMASVLAAAQQASRKLPPGEVIEAMAQHVSADISRPIDAAGVMLTDGGETLLMNIGYGLLRFKLTPKARLELTALCAEAET